MKALVQNILRRILYTVTGATAGFLVSLPLAPLTPHSTDPVVNTGLVIITIILLPFTLWMFHDIGRWIFQTVFGLVPVESRNG